MLLSACETFSGICSMLGYIKSINKIKKKSQKVSLLTRMETKLIKEEKIKFTNIWEVNDTLKQPMSQKRNHKSY